MSVRLDPEAVDWSSSAPITVTIGGLRVLPQLLGADNSADKKLTGARVLSVTAAIDTRVSYRGRRSALSLYLNPINYYFEVLVVEIKECEVYYVYY